MLRQYASITLAILEKRNMAQSRGHLVSLIGPSGQPPLTVCGKIKKKTKKERTSSQIKLDKKWAAAFAARKTRKNEELALRGSVIAGAPSTTKSATAGVDKADAPRSRLPPKWVSRSQEYFYGSSAACGGQPNIAVDDGDGAGVGTSDIDEEDGDGADAVINIDVDDGYGGDAVIDIMDKHFPPHKRVTHLDSLRSLPRWGSCTAW
jgi:hypothetical protein